MTTINETVTQSLRGAGYGSYEQYAAPVVSALVDREQQIAARLIQFAQGSDLNVDAVRTALQDCGMHMPQPWQVPAFAGQQAQQGQQGWQQSQQQAQTPPAQGMTTTPGFAQQQQPQPTGDPTVDVLQRIEQTLSGLVGFARTQGYSG